MVDINLKTVGAAEEEVIVKNHSYQDGEKAKDLYYKLTEDYAEQSVPFFEKDDKLIKIELGKKDSEEMDSECYLEYSRELLETLCDRI